MKYRGLKGKQGKTKEKLGNCTTPWAWRKIYDMAEVFNFFFLPWLSLVLISNPQEMDETYIFSKPCLSDHKGKGMTDWLLEYPIQPLTGAFACIDNILVSNNA